MNKLMLCALAVLVSSDFASSFDREASLHSEGDEPLYIEPRCYDSGGSIDCRESMSAAGRPVIWVLSTGYSGLEQAQFELDVERVSNSFFRSQSWAGARYASYNSRADRNSSLIFRSHFTPGGALGSATSKFSSSIVRHPFRQTQWNMAMDHAQVVEEVLRFRKQNGELSHPVATVVLFNDDRGELDGVGANAALPSTISQSFGIAKFTRGALRAPNPNYVVVHEIAHALLDFADEYIESTLAGVSIQSIDKITFLTQGFGGAIRVLFGIHQLRLSEIIAGNSFDNVDVTEYPSRVGENSDHLHYSAQGGMFFGRGTYHFPEANLMSSRSDVSHGDSELFQHSRPQDQNISDFFHETTELPRVNDRIRIAGPYPWFGSLAGRGTELVVYDGDKNHRFHPTQQYRVQVSFRSRRKGEWVTIERDYNPSDSFIRVDQTGLMKLARVAQDVACFFTQNKLNVAGQRLCSMNLNQVVGSFLPSLDFRVPYQRFRVELPEWFTYYYIRVATVSRGGVSSFTGWHRIHRSF